MQPATLYTWVAVFLALPILTACIALFRWRLTSDNESEIHPQRQLTGLRICMKLAIW